MYACKPERSVRQIRILVTLCVFITASLFFVATRFESYSSLVRLLAFISLMVSILLSVRYALTELEYSVGNGDFSVIKITGNRRQTVCCVALETAIDVLKKSDYDALPKNEKATIKYSLNQNMLADSYVFLCSFNGKRAMVEFEPNDAFVAIIKDEISRSIRNI